MQSTHRNLLVIPCLAACICAMAATSHAQTVKTWTGGSASNNRWGQADNWSPTGVPVANDHLVFGDPSLRSTASHNLSISDFSSITFTSGGFNVGPQTAAAQVVLGEGGLTVQPEVTGNNAYRIWTFLGGPRTIANHSPNSLLTFHPDLYTAPQTAIDNQGHLLTVDGVGNINFSSIAAIVGGGGLTKEGSGSLVLLGANMYSGETIVTGGRLTLSTAHSGGGGITAASGTAFEVVVAGVGTTIYCSTLSLGTVSGGAVTNDFNLGPLGNPAAPLIYANNLLTKGTVYVNVTGSGLSVGQVALIQHGGSIGGDGYTFVLNSLPAGVSGYLSNNTFSVDLVLLGNGGPVTNQPPTKYWAGLGGNNRWSQTGNWADGVIPAAGDMVVFGAPNRTTANYDLTSTISSNIHGVVFTNGGFNLAVQNIDESLVLGPGGITLQPGLIGNTTYRIRTFLDGPRGITNHATESRLIFTPDNAYLTPTAIFNEGHDLTFEGAGSFTFSFSTGNGTGVDAITGSGGIVKNGTGELLLNGTNSYTGATLVNAGSLRMNTVYVGGGPITVADGAVFGALVRQAGVSLKCSSLTLGTVSAGAVTNEFDLGTLGNPVAPVVSATNLTTAGTVYVKVTGSELSPGQFTLISYGGSIGGSGYTFVVESLPAGFTGYLANNPGSVDLIIESSISQTPTNISFVLSGNTLELSWPASHLGWYAQSNSVNVADPNAWFDIPNSQLATNLSIVNPAATKVFYRLRSP